jgi:site-specific DNA recombinase
MSLYALPCHQEWEAVPILRGTGHPPWSVIGIGKAGRIPARELEQLVLIELRTFFGSADRVTAIVGQAGEDLATTRALVDAAQQFAKALAGDSTSGLREILAEIVVRITVHQDSVEVHVSKEETRARLLNLKIILSPDSHKEPVVLTVAMKLKRCG